MLLLKNMIQRGPKGSHTIHTCLYCFFDPPNDQSTKTYLHSLEKKCPRKFSITS